MVNSSWKNLERSVAKALHGTRIPRGANFSDSLPDVIAASSKTIPNSQGIIYAECKYSMYNPWVDIVEKEYTGEPLIAKVPDDTLLLFDLKDISCLQSINLSKYNSISKKVPGYMLKHIEQSRSYTLETSMDLFLKATILKIAGTKDIKATLPIVVLAKRYKSFKLTYLSLKDLMEFYKAQDDKSYRKIYKT